MGEERSVRGRNLARRGVTYWCAALLILATHHSALATQWPSLFRGVVVADSAIGVRVITVDETSQAYLADLRPEDIIIRVNEKEIHSIDAFATVSQALKGRAVSTTVVVFRNGVPREVVVHLYSYPIRRAWGLEFIPDHDLRFAEPRVGLEYWARLGRGLEQAGKLGDSLDAYLNALHNIPADVDTAVKAGELFSRIGQERLRRRAMAGGISALRSALVVLERLFDQPLSDGQLQSIKLQLQATLEALRAVRS